MLLNLYLGTTAVSWATVLIYAVAIAKKAEREGYKTVKQEKSFIERVATYLSILFTASIPALNIINAIYILCMGDKLIDQIIGELVEEGKLYMPDEEQQSTDYEMAPESVEEKEIHYEVIPKTSLEKKYDEMTIEEKMAYIDRKREYLISQLPKSEEPDFPRKRTK